MKRKLTYEEIQSLIAQEDECGVNNLLQELFSSGKDNTTTLGKHVNVLGTFNEKKELMDYEVIVLKKEK